MQTSLIQQAMQSALSLQVMEAGITIYMLDVLPAVTVTGSGHPIRVNWAAVPGANRVEVTAAPARVGVAIVEEALGDLTINKVGSSYDVTIPGSKRILSLTLYNLKDNDDNILTSSSQLSSSKRLVVRTHAGGQVGAPLYAVPSVGQRGLLPPSLTGASYSNKVLKLPNLQATKIRLSLTDGSFPEEFDDESFTLERVTGIAAVFPTDIELVDHAGAVLWAFPGEFPPENPPMDVDVRINLESALNAALKAGQPTDVTFRLRGTAPSKAGFTFSAHGALVRDFPGVKTVELDGDPELLVLDETIPLASETPTSAVGDLTVTYKGIRIYEELSDTLPTSGALSGSIVASEQVARSFPPQAFTTFDLARVGIIGRAPLDCELAVQAVQMLGGRIGAPLGAPSVIQIAASTTVETHWIEFPPTLDLSGENIGLALRANTGRFFWVSVADQPLVKLAIYDPNPAGRPLWLNGALVVNITQPDETHLPAQNFPAGVFRVGSLLLASSLFLTVDVSDLALRYAR